LYDSDFLSNTEISKQACRQLIGQALQIVCDSWPENPYSGKAPAALAELVGSEFLPSTGRPEHAVDLWRTIVRNSIAVTHPHTVAHLHCPPLLASLAAEFVISALNQSMDSFDQAPMATVVEQKLLGWLGSEVGFQASADGTFTTGGSQSNYMGLLLARDAFIGKHWDWSVQKAGLAPDARRLRILCSEVAHFTVEKSASQLGLGTDAVVRVPVDDQFRMKPSALISALGTLGAEDLLPMAVVATAGTTDFGSIDPMPEIAAIARETGAWLHVDAAYGGALLFSPAHREKLRGIEAADSLGIDFHKLFWQPVPCSVFLLSDASHFEAIKLRADYLNPEVNQDEGIPDLVTTSLLTSRRFDALKVWTSFELLGRKKLASMIDRTIALAHRAAEAIRRTPQLELVCEPQLSTVVFRYIPQQPEVDADQLNAAIRRSLFHQGLAVIGHTRVGSRQCLKFTCMNPATTEQQMEELIARIVAQGRNLGAASTG
jgi:L-2,4-diaminobutyrate decarboxylase